MKKIILFSLIFNTFLYINAQNPVFDSLANEMTRISGYSKQYSLEKLDTLYMIARNSPDSCVLIARCIYEEAVFKQRHGFIDTLLSDKIKNRLTKTEIPLLEYALLQSALGIHLITDGEYAEAFEIMLKALELFKKMNNNSFIERTYVNLGIICYCIRLNNLAEYYYLEAIAINNQESVSYIPKSNLFLTIEDRKAAVDSIRTLIDILEKENNVEQLPMIYLNMGSRLLSDNPEEAMVYFSKLISLDFDNTKYKSLLDSNLGIYYLNKKDYLQAINYFRKACFLMENNKEFKNLVNIYQLMSMAFEGKNQTDSALFYAKKQIELSKVISSNIIAIETYQKYITTLVESQKNELIIAEQENKLKKRQFTITLIVSISVILLILMFLIIVYQQKSRKEAENKTLYIEREAEKKLLNAKKREITSYSLLVSNKNQVLKQIGDYINKLLDTKENINQTLNEIIKLIKINLNIDEEWKNFKRHFESVNPEFFIKLKKKCPELTEENLRICAYIKMGLKSKDISQLLNITPKSVNTNRSRLRKKLDVPDDVELDDFLRNI